MASNELKTIFTKHFPINMDKKLSDSIKKIVTQYEIKGENPLALNSPYLGIHDFYFTDEDRQVIFNICNLTEDDVKEVIKNIKVVKKEYKVISDPFNLFTSYLIYKSLTSKSLPSKQAFETALYLHVYLQYRFFTSFVNHLFPFKVDQDVMQYVIENLTLKYDIKKYGTWKNVIYERAKAYLDPKSIHYKTYTKFEPDDKVFYSISDLQTRIRNQLKNISNLYYQTKEQKESVFKTTDPYVELDGERLIKDPQSVFDHLTSYVMSLIANNYVNKNYIEFLTKYYFTSLSPSIFETAVSYLSIEYINQSKENKLTAIKKKGKFTIYVGLQTLIEKTIEVSYLYCIHNNINVKNKLLVLTALKRLYSSSRLENVVYLNIKESFVDFIRRNKITSRSATVSSLYNALLLYIIMVSMEVLTIK